MRPRTQHERAGAAARRPRPTSWVLMTSVAPRECASRRTVAEEVAGVEVEAGEGLVEEQQLRFVQEHARQRAALQEAARQRAHRSMRPAAPAPSRSTSVVDARLRVGDAEEARVEAQVLARAEIGIEPALVAEHGDAAAHGRALRGGVESEDAHACPRSDAAGSRRRAARSSCRRRWGRAGRPAAPRSTRPGRRSSRASVRPKRLLRCSTSSAARHGSGGSQRTREKSARLRRVFDVVADHDRAHAFVELVARFEREAGGRDRLGEHDAHRPPGRMTAQPRGRNLRVPLTLIGTIGRPVRRARLTPPFLNSWILPSRLRVPSA